jgi:hypothetical protein
MYIELPPGYGIPGKDKVYKVTKSLYGDIGAAKLWYKHLSSALVNKLGIGLTAISHVDGEVVFLLCSYHHNTRYFLNYRGQLTVVTGS